jgi:hypothetical protein
MFSAISYYATGRGDNCLGVIILLLIVDVLEVV